MDLFDACLGLLLLIVFCLSFAACVNCLLWIVCGFGFLVGLIGLLVLFVYVLINCLITCVWLVILRLWWIVCLSVWLFIVWLWYLVFVFACGLYCVLVFGGFLVVCCVLIVCVVTCGFVECDYYCVLIVLCLMFVYQCCLLSSLLL